MLRIQEQQEKELTLVRIEEIKKTGGKLLFRPNDLPYFVALVTIPMDSICDDGHTDVLIEEIINGWPSKKYDAGKLVSARLADLEEMSE